MRISDWSSDVCSSDLIAADAAVHGEGATADRLDTIVDGMIVAVAPAELQRLAFEFWEVLVDGSGNIAYRLAFNSLRKTYEPIWDLLTHMLGRDLQKLGAFRKLEIGSASCRERVCQYV